MLQVLHVPLGDVSRKETILSYVAVIGVEQGGCEYSKHCRGGLCTHSFESLPRSLLGCLLKVVGTDDCPNSTVQGGLAHFDLVVAVLKGHGDESALQLMRAGEREAGLDNTAREPVPAVLEEVTLDGRAGVFGRMCIWKRWYGRLETP